MWRRSARLSTPHWPANHPESRSLPPSLRCLSLACDAGELGRHEGAHLAIDEALIDPAEVVVWHEAVHALARAQVGRASFGDHGGSGFELPGALIEEGAVEDLVDSIRRGIGHFDLILEGDAPETGLADVGSGGVALGIDLPGTGGVGQVVLTIVGDNELLAKGVLFTVGAVSLALTLPHANKGEEPQETIVQGWALPQVGGLIRQRVLRHGHGGDIARGGILPCLRGLIDGLVAVNLGVLRVRAAAVFGLVLVIRLFAHAAPA